MDARIATIVRGTTLQTLQQVVAGVLGSDAPVGLDGPPQFAEIRRPHAEDRTIGIVRASGTAGGRTWSSVVKIVDLAIPGAERTAGLTWPENEEHVYERGLFADEGLSFRAARCYALTRPEGEVRLFWLEDLSGAQGTPFTLEQLARMTRHLGEWNGRHSEAPPTLGFPLGRDAYVRRFSGWNYPKQLARLESNADHPLVRAAFRSGAAATLRALVASTARLLERLSAAPHGLAFGNISAGNVFSLPHETVAIDWASLTDDPVGVDGGCLIGSSFSWGPAFMDVVRAQAELFESYMEGLRAGGWYGERDDARRASLAQIGSYLITTALTPSLLVDGDDWLRNFIEGRFGLPQADVCARLSDLVAILPGFVEEIEGLLTR
jgi:hypothetical protein